MQYKKAIKYKIPHAMDGVERRTKLGKIMSFSVFKYMTFGAGNRAMRSIDPCPKCGVDKTVQRALARTRFFVARATEGGEAYTVCYATFAFYKKIPLIIVYINGQQYLYCKNSSGNI